MTTGTDIVNYARTWIGARWQHQGRGVGPHRAIDCAGLLIRTARHFNIPHGDMLGYRRDPSKDFLDHVKNHTLPARDIVNGAIGVFSDSIQPCHTGIFAVEDGHITLIHSEAHPVGFCHEEDFEGCNPPMSDRLICIRLFKEVNYGI